MRRDTRGHAGFSSTHRPLLPVRGPSQEAEVGVKCIWAAQSCPVTRVGGPLAGGALLEMRLLPSWFGPFWMKTILW
jgi:hypothetical protein